MMNTTRYIHRTEVTSTNTYVKELLQAGVELPDITLVSADFQSGGRGQRGNSWESARGENLTFSIVCHPEGIKACRQFVLSQAIALAVCDTVGEYIDHVTVKWPNDIYWHDRKLCGILIECTLSGDEIRDCIIGVGLNVNQTTFTSDAPNPVSLAQIIGFSLNRDMLLRGIADAFSTLYDQLQAGKADEIESAYKQRLYRREGFYRYQEPGGDEFDAEIVDVEPSGHLVLGTQEGVIRKYEFKEVKFII